MVSTWNPTGAILVFLFFSSRSPQNSSVLPSAEAYLPTTTTNHRRHHGCRYFQAIPKQEGKNSNKKSIRKRKTTTSLSTISSISSSLFERPSWLQCDPFPYAQLDVQGQQPYVKPFEDYHDQEENYLHNQQQQPSERIVSYDTGGDSYGQPIDPPELSVGRGRSNKNKQSKHYPNIRPSGELGQPEQKRKHREPDLQRIQSYTTDGKSFAQPIRPPKSSVGRAKTNNNNNNRKRKYFGTGGEWTQLQQQNQEEKEQRQSYASGGSSFKQPTQEPEPSVGQRNAKTRYSQLEKQQLDGSTTTQAKKNASLHSYGTDTVQPIVMDHQLPLSALSSDVRSPFLSGSKNYYKAKHYYAPKIERSLTMANQEGLKPYSAIRSNSSNSSVIKQEITFPPAESPPPQRLATEMGRDIATAESISPYPRVQTQSPMLLAKGLTAGRSRFNSSYKTQQIYPKVRIPSPFSFQRRTQGNGSLNPYNEGGVSGKEPNDPPIQKKGRIPRFKGVPRRTQISPFVKPKYSDSEKTSSSGDMYTNDNLSEASLDYSTNSDLMYTEESSNTYDNGVNGNFYGQGTGDGVFRSVESYNDVYQGFGGENAILDYGQRNDGYDHNEEAREQYLQGLYDGDADDDWYSQSHSFQIPITINICGREEMNQGNDSTEQTINININVNTNEGEGYYEWITQQS
ncbi:unnamed protein product [Pseudo-nitzschia multistriata]|uniref:Uncharacterized protein n=1 Tax=Pseudo-nitzschia multistriata TaxID=183589 RepID=A0A448YYU7_9STRA|nr:unnamed protein product [Pseudo-nitzschia multistriata]